MPSRRVLSRPPNDPFPADTGSRTLSRTSVCDSVAAVGIAGCGGDDGDSGSDYKLRTTAFKSNAVREPGESGTMKIHACATLSPAFVARSVHSGALKRSPNNSLDLSICDWDGARTQREALRGHGAEGTAPLLQPARRAARVLQRGPGAARRARSRAWARTPRTAAPARGGRAGATSLWCTTTTRCSRSASTCAAGVTAGRARPPIRSGSAPSASDPGLARLAGRPHHDLVHAHVRRERHGVHDLLGDVLGLQHLADLLA